MGCEAECELLLSRDERGSRALRCTVLHVHAQLPDGYYEALFGAQSAFLRHGDGAWSTGIAWAVIPERKKADPIAEPSITGWTRTLAGNRPIWEPSI
jgi:hypothetical protein